MKESIEKRIEAVRTTEDCEVLKKSLCPFYALGGHPDCVGCKQTEDTLLDCRQYYMDRIFTVPQDIWSEEFDRLVVNKREKVSLESVTGVGITCNNCYMYDKCPLFKKDFECGIIWGEDQPSSPGELMDFLVNVQYERVKRSSVFEKIDGGVPDAGLSGEIDRLTGLIVSKTELNRDRFSINVEASSPAQGGGGILARLFGGGSAPALPEEKKVLTITEKSEGVGDLTEFTEVKEKERVARKSKR